MKIKPCLWLNHNVQEVIDFYTAVFKNVHVLQTSYYPADFPGFGGEILVADIQINEQPLMLLNGGPSAPYNETVSFFIEANTQQEIDYYWANLSAGGGSEGQCGWLKDRFGLSWQVAPAVLGHLLQDADREMAERVLQAMMKMRKIVIHDLEEAAKE